MQISDLTLQHFSAKLVDLNQLELVPQILLQNRKGDPILLHRLGLTAHRASLADTLRWPERWSREPTASLQERDPRFVLTLGIPRGRSHAYRECEHLASDWEPRMPTFRSPG